MALRKSHDEAGTTSASTTQAAFEADEDDSVAAPVAATAPAPSPAAQDAAPKESAPPVVSAVTAIEASGALVEKSAGSEFAAKVAAMKGAADFAFGNYPVFKGNNGEIMMTDGKGSFGRWVKVTLIAWDEHFEVSPNNDGKGAKEVVAYSKDGETVDSVIGDEMKAWVGQTVDDYIKHIRQDFPNAAKRRFIDTACFVHENDKGDDSFMGEAVQITLSPSSIKSFGQYQEKLVQKARMVEMGLPVKIPENPFTFCFLREVVSDKGRNWTKLQIVDKVPTRL